MKIRIWQIDTDLDKERRLFQELPSRNQEKPQVISSNCYTLVFAGEVKATTMESVFTTFNVRHPRHYYGRSLSVSDVVEVVESTERVEAGFYFCDVYGFKKVEFNPSAAAETYIRVIIVDPNKDPVLTYIPKNLKAYQGIVGGWIQLIRPWLEDDVGLICNDDGKPMGLPLNRTVVRKGKYADTLVGTFFIAGRVGEEGDMEVGSIPEELVDNYLKKSGQRCCGSTKKQVPALKWAGVKKGGYKTRSVIVRNATGANLWKPRMEISSISA